MSLENDNKSMNLWHRENHLQVAGGWWRAAGTICGFTEGCQGAMSVFSQKDARREQRTLATGTFEKVCGMIKFWAPWSAHFILWQILSWSLQRLNQSQCQITGKINTLSYDNSYPRNIVCLVCLSIYYLQSDPQQTMYWEPISSDFQQTMHWEYLKKFGLTAYFFFAI